MDLSERPPSNDFRRHPWEVARARFFQRIMAGGLSRPLRILDVGAGDGWFTRELLAQLPAGSSATCWDVGYSPETIETLSSGSTANVEFVAARPSDRYDLILMLDVIEHVEDDVEFLTSTVRDNLEPGGTAVLIAPAFPSLYTSHDRLLRHFRRYVPAEAFALIERSGLVIERRGGLFHSLLLPRAIRKVRETVVPSNTETAPESLEWTRSPLVTNAVDLALRIDNEISVRAARLPFVLPGLSWWALCKKP